MASRGGGGVGGTWGAAPDATAFAINLLAGGMLVADIIKQNTPTLEDEVVVEVIGQPGATKQQLYFLALAAASSVVRQIAPLSPAIAFISPSAGMLMIEYDAADNWVRATLKYQSGMAVNYAASLTNALPGNLFDQLAVYRGPPCNLNGAPFGFVASISNTGKKIFGDALSAGVTRTAATLILGPVLALADIIGTIGIPADSTSASAPQLPFAGQPILSTCPTTPTPIPRPITQSQVPDTVLGIVGPTIPSPNPKPPGDNRSRGAIPTPTASAIVSGVVSGGATSGTSEVVGTATGVSGSSTPDGTCCNISLTLIPLVFAALSAPATNASMTFPNPVPGAPPNG